ncbi:mechanosensitive ion channel protein 10-like [Salvia miltiorrhiza]|uniref:mechanosensitive ion channel protein 10-like n=1 Tax=Salvia miltiorrhiza TaxID=226208 RepID=UPI0025ACF092|nr:mechanosensitive ion channel protein 10-like [Salvia miltiorrhiza]
MDDTTTSSDHHVIHFMDDLNQNHNDKPHPHQTNNRASEANKLRRLSFSKPKSRFGEFSPLETLNEATSPTDDDDDSDGSVTTDDDDDDDRAPASSSRRRKNKKAVKINWRILVEWILFILISTSLVSSLTIPSLKAKLSCGLESWRWCLMILVTFSGRLVSGWIMRVCVFLVERNFMLREKVLYFVYGLRKSIQNCVWLGLVLLSWTFIFNAKLHKNNRLLKKLFQGLVAVLIAATIWLVKIILVKVLASSFHVATYFDRMKESVFQHYVLDTLSGPPMDAAAYEAAHEPSVGSRSMPARMREARVLSRRFGTRKIDMEKLRKLSMQNTASAWTIKRLVNYVRFFGLSTISKTVDQLGGTGSEITSEWEARNCAKRIFKHVAKPGAKYIEEEDLMRFLKRVEIHTIFPLFEGALETGKISKPAFRNWVVRAYYERKSLAHSLNDTKTAVQQLHKIASAIVSMIIVVVTVLVMGLASTKVIAFIITQLLLVGFTFQNMCKTVFESIVFVFVMHPFDIGDRCVIDGVQLIVEEMNILTTVFLRYDNEKIYYPNSVLITKPISNFYRSPEMSDAINFSIDVSTPMDTIITLKKSIQTYIESKPNYWNPKHSIIVKEIENLDKLKMALCVQHTINHQNYGDRNIRITELFLELKKIFENLNMKYHLLPQEIHLTQVNMNY